MSLFTDPLVLNDGSADRTFKARGPVEQGGAIIGYDYIEPAQSSKVDSRIVVKHTLDKSGLQRDFVQVRSNQPLPEAFQTATLIESPCFCNFSMGAYPGITDAVIQAHVTLLIDAISEANFVQYLRLKMS
jgi:hypothetical protein